MLVDEYTLLRQAMTLLLQWVPDISMTAEAGSLSEVREVLQDESLKVDIVLVNLDLPIGLDYVPLPDATPRARAGVEDSTVTMLIEELQNTRPSAIVLILSAGADPTLMARVIEAGAASVIPKSAPIADILHIIRRLHKGEQLLSQQEIIKAVHLVGRKRLEGVEARAKLDKITPREQDVLYALADGLGDKEIAQALYITPGTVRVHMVSILAKLETHSRLQALLFAMQHGFVKIGQHGP